VTVNTYSLGDVVRVQVTLSDDNGAVDPGTVICYVTDPTGVKSTIGAARDGPGVYHADITVPKRASMVGAWYYRFEVSGTDQGAEEWTFNVKPSRFY
jgi:uncharacterized protein YfaS (alpha-2-macroglobulin family)